MRTILCDTEAAEWNNATKQAEQMGPLRKLGQTALICLLGLSLVVWAILPAFTHTPATFDTPQKNIEIVAEHDHPHGEPGEHIDWTHHGHSHDAIDHDHSQAVMAFGGGSNLTFGNMDDWRPYHSSAWPSQLFKIERPPRA